MDVAVRLSPKAFSVTLQNGSVFSCDHGTIAVKYSHEGWISDRFLNLGSLLQSMVSIDAEYGSAPKLYRHLGRIDTTTLISCTLFS